MFELSPFVLAASFFGALAVALAGHEDAALAVFSVGALVAFFLMLGD